jgi:hypothetical protein
MRSASFISLELGAHVCAVSQLRAWEAQARPMNSAGFVFHEFGNKVKFVIFAHPAFVYLKYVSVCISLDATITSRLLRVSDAAALRGVHFDLREEIRACVNKFAQKCRMCVFVAAHVLVPAFYACQTCQTIVLAMADMSDHCTCHGACKL